MPISHSPRGEVPRVTGRGGPSPVLTWALTGASVPATSRTSSQWAVDDQPGSNRFTSSSAYRSRVMNQPVTVRTTTPASTRTNIAA